MDNKEQQMMGTLITPAKIWANIKNFWWFCLIPLLLCSVLVYRDTMAMYRINQAAAQKDTYAASALMYYPTADEASGRGSIEILKSGTTVKRVNQILAEQGYELFDSGVDYLDVGHNMASYTMTLVGVGKDRMLCMAEAFTSSMLEVIEEATGVAGCLVGEVSILPCMVDASGAIRVYQDVSERQVSLSLGDFLTWKNLLVLCAGVFLGLALIFAAILFDDKIRSREELESVCQISCLGIVGTKKEKDKKLVVSLIRTMCEKQQVGKLMVTAVSAEPMLGILAEAVKGQDTRDVITCEQAATSAETIELCRDCDAVVLTVRKNKDKATVVKRAIVNLETIEVPVIGYILTE